MRKSVVFSVLVIVAVTGLIVAGLAVISGRGFNEGTAASSLNSTTTQQVPNRPACPGPGVAGIDMDCLGAEADSGEESGIAVVNVWAWWCEPCRAELPALQEFADNHPAYRVVGVHADRNAAGGAALLNELGVDIPSYQDPTNAFAGQLGLPPVVPVTLVVRDGDVIHTFLQPFYSAAELEKAVSEVV
ncbi:TlpA family protein disulfide reductase [Corynebacterium mayonis]|uniref:TlpA family protein disulfide reductase n=1 Tax=Corynebacterium mayonis TaxID=3062461 RepID=UPI003140AD10